MLVPGTDTSLAHVFPLTKFLAYKGGYWYRPVTFLAVRLQAVSSIRGSHAAFLLELVHSSHLFSFDRGARSSTPLTL